MKTVAVLMLLSASLWPQAKPPTGRVTNPAMPEPVRQLIESLPPASGWRRMLQHGARGDGIRRPWMDDMQKNGVKLAVFTFEFDWIQKGNELKDWTLVSEQYFRDYDRSQPIVDQRDLDGIRASGLEAKLQEVALSKAKSGNWFEYPSEQRGTGYRQLLLADDEWLPVELSPWFGQYEPGTTPLMHAAMLGDVPRIRRLLSEGAEVNAVGPQGSTALRWAAAAGNPPSIEALLSAGADVNANPGRMGDALVAAVANNRPENVRVLLKAGADPASKNGDGETVLCLATRQHLAGIVQLLKQAGAGK